jgi:hypothetical protein
MIRINLLPQEKRHPEKPPLTNLLVLGGGTLVVTCLGLYLGLSLTWLAGMNKKIEDKGKEKASLQPYEKDYDSLRKEVGLMEQRSKAITEIKKSRIIMWSRVVDELCECVADSSTVWLLTLKGTDQATTVKTDLRGAGAKGTVERELTFDIQSASEDYDKITEFRELLKKRLLTPVISMDEKGTKGSFFNGWNDPLKIDQVKTVDYDPPVCQKTNMVLQRVKEGPAAGPAKALTPETKPK